MIRLALGLLATAAGIVWCEFLLPGRWYLIGGGALLLVGCCLRARHLAIYGLLPLILAMSAWSSHSRLPHLLPNDLFYYAPLPHVTVEGNIVGEPQLKTDGIALVLSAQRMLTPQVAIVRGLLQISLQQLPEQRLEAGMAIRISGRLRLPPAASYPGGFSYRTFLQRRGIFTVLQTSPHSRVAFLPEKDIPNPFRWVGRWRSRLLAAMTAGLDASEASFFGSLVLGDRASPVADQVQEDFRNTGLAAVLAASGMQVTLLLGLCLWLGERLRASNRMVVLLSAPILLVYVLLTGDPPSIQRAAWVALFALAGRFWGHTVQPIAALLLAGWLIIVVNPQSTYDLGLILSLLATFGVLHTAPRLAGAFTWLPQPLAQICAMTLGAQLWVLPVQVYTFATVSPLFLPANLAAAPLVELLTDTGVMTAVAGLLSPALATYCNLINGLGLRLLLWWAHWLAGLPGWQWQVQSPPWIPLVLVYPAMLAFSAAWRAPDERARRYQWCLGLFALQMAALPCFWPHDPPVRVTVVSIRGSALTVVQQLGQPALLIGGAPAVRVPGRQEAADSGPVQSLVQHLGARPLVIMPTPPLGRACGALLPLLAQEEIAALWDVGGRTTSASYGKLWALAWQRHIPGARLWPLEQLVFSPETRLQVLSTPAAAKEPFLMKLTTGSFSLLWAEGVPPGWTNDRQLPLAATWLLTQARQVPPSLLAAVQPQLVLTPGPAGPTGTEIAAQVIHLAAHGPVQWPEESPDPG